MPTGGQDPAPPLAVKKGGLAAAAVTLRPGLRSSQRLVSDTLRESPCRPQHLLISPAFTPPCLSIPPVTSPVAYTDVVTAL